jgi:hypothetical protein
VLEEARRREGGAQLRVLASHVSQELPWPQCLSHDSCRSDAEQAIELLASELPINARDADGQRAAVVPIEIGLAAQKARQFDRPDEQRRKRGEVR